MKFVNLLVLGLLLNSACRASHHHRQPESAAKPLPAAMGIPPKKSVITEVPEVYLSPLKTQGCSIDELQNVASCEAPATFEAADALFIQLYRLKSFLAEYENPANLQLTSWKIHVQEALDQLEKADVMVAKGQEIATVQARIEAAVTLARPIYIADDLPYSKRLSGILLLESLVQDPDFRADLERLNVKLLGLNAGAFMLMRYYEGSSLLINVDASFENNLKVVKGFEPL